MKYERLRNNSERLRKIGAALDSSMEGAEKAFIRNFVAEATKRMKAAGIPQDKMRMTIGKYARNLQSCILSARHEVKLDYMKSAPEPDMSEPARWGYAPFTPYPNW